MDGKRWMGRGGLKEVDGEKVDEKRWMRRGE